MFCKNCGKEIKDDETVCVHCGSTIKSRKPLHKRWWFWVLVALSGIITLAAITGNSDDDLGNNLPTGTSSSITENKKEYQIVDLRTMFDELESNALKAEKNYQDKYIEVKGRIRNIDSDGTYISIEPINADAFSFTTMLCYIKADDQLDFILEKEEGDTVTIKGKVRSVGEVLGYSINIDEIY